MYRKQTKRDLDQEKSGKIMGHFGYCFYFWFYMFSNSSNNERELCSSWILVFWVFKRKKEKLECKTNHIMRHLLDLFNLVSYWFQKKNVCPLLPEKLDRALHHGK